MVKDIIEFILFSVILTFIWNSVRNFLFPPQRSRRQGNKTSTTGFESSNRNSKKSHGLNWDAEDAEFEEIKEEEKLTR